MLRTQKKKSIILLRKKMLGYKLIAEKLKITRDQVRDFLRTKKARRLLKGSKHPHTKPAILLRKKAAKRVLRKKKK